jgi:hypothetical protein
MLIGHLFNQLLEQSFKIKELLERFKKLTTKFLWQQLLATIKYQVLCSETLAEIDGKKHQIRLFAG